MQISIIRSVATVVTTLALFTPMAWGQENKPVEILSDAMASIFKVMPNPAECLKNPTPENCGSAYDIMKSASVSTVLKQKGVR